MPDLSATITIPNRSLFKPSEVCDLVKVQPYVLRTWEAEFPTLGVTKATGAPRVYRREDVEQVVRIRHLLLVEGLTLAGARRRLDEETSPVAADAPIIDQLIGQNARERLTEVKRGLRSILDLLADRKAPPGGYIVMPREGANQIRARATPARVTAAKSRARRAPPARRKRAH